MTLIIAITVAALAGWLLGSWRGYKAGRLHTLREIHDRMHHRPTKTKQRAWWLW